MSETVLAVEHLTTGFDVTEPGNWAAVGPVEIACLNAGVLGGPADPAASGASSAARAPGNACPCD